MRVQDEKQRIYLEWPYLATTAKPLAKTKSPFLLWTLANAPINALPHHPPLGRKWGFTGGIDTKLLPHYGAFDNRSVSAQIFFVVTSFAMPNPELIPRYNWGQRWGFDTIGLPYYGAFDIRLCQIPTIAPYMPEGGGGVVGQYIDRCIISMLKRIDQNWGGGRGSGAIH